MQVEEENERLLREIAQVRKEEANAQKKRAKAESTIAKSKDKRKVAELVQQVDDLKRSQLEALEDYQQQHKALRENITLVYGENATLLKEIEVLKTHQSLDGEIQDDHRAPRDGDKATEIETLSKENEALRAEVASLKEQCLAQAHASDEATAADTTPSVPLVSDEQTSALQEELSALKAQCERLAEDLAGTREQQSTGEKAVDDIKKERDAVMRTYESEKNLCAKYKAKNEQLSARLKDSDARAQELEDRAHHGDEGQAQRYKAANQKLSTKLTAAQHQLDEQKAKALQMEQKYGQKLQRLQVQVNESDSKMKAMAQDATKYKEKYKLMKGQCEGLSKAAKEKAEALDQSSARLGQCESELTSARATVTDLEQKYAFASQGHEQAKEENDFVRDEYKKTLTSLKATGEMMEEQQGQISALEKELAAVKEKASLDAAAAAEELRMQTATLHDESGERIGALEEDLRAVQEAKAALEGQVEDIKVELNDAKASLAESETKITELTQEVERLMSELDRTKEEAATLQTSFEELKADHAKSLEGSAAQISLLEEQKQDMAQTLEDLEAKRKIDLKKVDNIVKDLKKSLEKERSVREQLEAEADRRQELEVVSAGSPRKLSRMSSAEDAASSSREGGGISFQELEEENNSLIGRVAELQRAKWTLEERLRAHEEMVGVLKTDLDQKSLIIQQYVAKERARGEVVGGPEVREAVPPSPAAMSMQDRIGGFFKSPTKTRGDEVNTKMQAVLEETLCRNIQLEKDHETLGDEVARLMEENNKLRGSAS